MREAALGEPSSVAVQHVVPVPLQWCIYYDDIRIPDQAIRTMEPPHRSVPLKSGRRPLTIVEKGSTAQHAGTAGAIEAS